jgi:hypothetical protein
VRPSKLLFVLNHALYLRNYGPVISGLAERGHTLEVAFTQGKPDDAERFARFVSDRTGISLVEAPERMGWWWAAADPLRALRDYVHYLHPDFDEAPKLVDRTARRVPPAARRLFGRRGPFPRIRRYALNAVLGFIERSLPPDPGVRDWLRDKQPDAVLVSPLIDLDYNQLDVLKTARALGIPTGHLVASWDNLTNKGRIQLAADRLVVWNDFQKAEAKRLHNVDPERVVVTGAQLFDHWFEMKPRERGEFCRHVGSLDPARPFLLYVGSSSFICPDETQFVLNWLRRIRGHSDPALRGAQVLLRPHPLNAAQWEGVDFSGLGPVEVWPSSGAMPIGTNERRDYFDSLWHCAAVVGVNTSVFLEAAILGRRLFTLSGPEFSATQEGTLHFRYIAEGGLVQIADSMNAHLTALADAMSGDGGDRPGARAFLERFVRPRGLEFPALPAVIDAIESIASLKRRSSDRQAVTAPLVRALLAPLAAAYLRPNYLAKLRLRQRA